MDLRSWNGLAINNLLPFIVTLRYAGGQWAEQLGLYQNTTMLSCQSIYNGVDICWFKSCAGENLTRGCKDIWQLICSLWTERVVRSW